MDGCDFVVIGFLVLLPRASECFKKLAFSVVGLLFLLSSSSSNSCSETVWTSIFCYNEIFLTVLSNSLSLYIGPFLPAHRWGDKCHVVCAFLFENLLS